MKKTTSILLVVLCCTSQIFAQKTFDEATFMAMMNRLQTDPAFFKNEADPSFTILFGNGTQSNQEGMLKFAQANVGLYKRKETNLKVIQVGSTAIATGLVEESFYAKENPQLVSRSDKEYYTYTFTLNKGKWLWLAAQHTDFQEPFTKETLNEIMAEYKTDSKAFFNKYLASDFRYTNNNGAYQYQKEFLGGTAQSIVATELLQPVIFQSGDLATVSGLHQTIRTNKEGSQQTSQEAATYTFQRRSGKWMFVASQHTLPTAPTAYDEAAIKLVIESETNSFKSRDADKAISHWLKAPYVSHSYTTKGLGYIRGHENVSAAIKNYLKTYPMIDSSPTDYHDYIIRVNGSSAWATWISASTLDGKKMDYNKAAYLQKTGGLWKMASAISVAAQ